MPWLPIVFVIIVVLMIIILGYFLIRNFLRDTLMICPPEHNQNARHFLEYA